MTQIKIEVPANDHIALSAMADALQRIASERAPSVTTGDSLVKQCEEFKIPKGDDFVEPVDIGTLPDYETSIANFHTEPRVRDSVTEQGDTTKHDEVFEEGEKLFDAEIARMDEEREQDDTLDADGIPHDKRIHSKGATRLADNTWRLRKRPADKTEEEWTTYINSVKAELKAVQAITLAPLEPVEQGPFYWSHDESDSCGEVQTLEELHAMIEGDSLVNQIDKESYDKRVEIGYDNSVNDITPPTLDEQAVADLTPPVIDTDTPQGMSEANEPAAPNGDVAIEPPVTTTGAPVAPVTPPTSLTPPVVEADKPSVTTFQELMLYMTSDAKKRGADNDMIKATLLEVDPALTAIPLIATRADLIPKFVEVLEAKLV